MTNDLDVLGVEASEVQSWSTGRNVLIGIVGLVVVIGGLIPLTIGAIWVATYAYAGVVAFVSGAPAAL